jgi:hypothetical protein
MALSELLTWVLSGGGAGVVSYWLMEHLAFLVQLKPQSKRYVSLAIAGGLAILGYLAAVGMGYQAEPGTVKGWVEVLFSVVGVAVGLSQFIHGAKKL